MARLTESLATYPEGKSALQFARDHNMAVRFASQYSQYEHDLIDGSNAAYDPKSKAILLNPEKPDDRLLSDIPHEIWHADQDGRGILSTIKQVANPTQKIALKYVVEAAAYTEQALDGVPLPKDEMKVTADGKTLMDLRVVYDNAIKAHETPEAARLDVFKAALKYESKFDYSVDIGRLGDKMEALAVLAPDDPKRKAVTGDTAELSNEKLAEIMRRAGNVSLSPGAGNIFSSMSDADLIQLSTSQLTPQNKEALRKTQVSYEAVRGLGTPTRNTR